MVVEGYISLLIQLMADWGITQIISLTPMWSVYHLSNPSWRMNAYRRQNKPYISQVYVQNRLISKYVSVFIYLLLLCCKWNVFVLFINPTLLAHYGMGDELQMFHICDVLWIVNTNKHKTWTATEFKNFFKHAQYHVSNSVTIIEQNRR